MSKICFDAVYKGYHSRIQSYLNHLSGEADAADLTQSVFLKVSQSLDGYRGDSSLATWIYRIATNTALDHADSSLVKQKNLEHLFDVEGSVESFADTGVPGTDQEYIRREMNACIRSLVDQLPENYRTVLLLSDFEEFTNSEIASILDLSIETIKIRLHRGRTVLRKAMECQCSFYYDDRSELMCDRKAN